MCKNRNFFPKNQIKMFPFEQFSQPKPPQSSFVNSIDFQTPNKLEGFLEQLMSKENQMKCLVHSQEEIQFFCLDLRCKRNLACTECLLEGIHEGHDVKKIDKLSDSWIEMLKSSEIKLKYYKESLELLKKKLEGVSQTISQGIDHRKLEISKAFELVMENLMKKQKDALEFLDKENHENSTKQKEKIEILVQKIKNCSDGLEKITYAENFHSLSILDLSNNFSQINELMQKVEQINQEQYLIDSKEFKNENIRYNCDLLLSNLANFENLISNSLSFSENNVDQNHFNHINKEIIFNKNTIKIQDIPSPILYQDESCKKTLKESIEIRSEWIKTNKNFNESSTFKRKLQQKYGQLLEVFKPELAKSKLSFYMSDNSKQKTQKINACYQTPSKKIDIDEDIDVWNGKSKYSFINSLEKQKLKYVNSAQKLI